MKDVNWIENKDGSLWLTEDDRGNLQIRYRLKDILFSEQSPFQHVAIVDTADFGRTLVLDGVVQTTAIDGHIYNEMITHVPIHLHPNPKKVLIIGGGDCGAARELTKYEGIEQIDMVEIDELVVKACKTHLPEVSGNLSDPRVHFIFDDGVKFVKEKENEYDCIIVDSSDPVGPAEVLFEYDFYASLKRALKEDGLMVCQSQSPIFHQSILKQTVTHIRNLFPDSKTYTAVVPTYPGGLWSFTIGSKKYPIDPKAARKENVKTKYFNRKILESCFILPEFMKELLNE
ncbi:polyamine aminopropyltransferase [Fervidibacillus halotolerans]|uniref:Polyamine aminopropyltransferase n=1 Tax=Fervidibacillus halotolerans TaxID=2980027 RepID=A0A9E8LYP5_9BACI|nr:polyamine aminopropyltransferase [Fervidibacillus halotolerans]WAA12223.1 polyamine aminopropyltransferase [Fervidibacillus halotolerans]